MTKTLFGEPYSSLYDSFFRDKDYEAKYDLLEEAFRRHSDGSVRTILDLGCGTGNRVKVIRAAQGQIIRVGTGSLDVRFV